MSIVLSGQDGVMEQARRQLEDLVPVWAVLDYTNTRVITREFLLVSVHLGPEYLEDQLLGGPSHKPRRGFHPPHRETKLEKETTLAHNFERGAHPNSHTEPHNPSPLTPSEALRLKHQHLQSISVLSDQFGAKIVDVSENSVIVELTAKTIVSSRFSDCLMAMPRTPITHSSDDSDDAADEIGVVCFPLVRWSVEAAVV
ncbi:uncharacterized protein F5147DRAFT_840549 [Suillus discolor]|uniref:Acetolactate synthase small subunit n=1 Tax=Suillus discolor TaxID=1912936 RepID=A0A9P7JNP5_9AGAM|nr:uncharacterized protein F5147DRAFT_840549 [Suillus discolor]KAG2093135.1 hypothetical protein F5147DRAFT_840549 [Suillus discolor]